jgi:hypothetical protein
LNNPTTLPPPCYRGPLATFDESFFLEFVAQRVQKS